MTKIAEQAERYDGTLKKYVYVLDMIQYITSLAELGVELTNEERNLFIISYKCAISSQRAAYRSSFYKFEKNAHPHQLQMLADYKQNIENERNALFIKAIATVDMYIIPNCTSMEGLASWYKTYVILSLLQ